MLDMPLLGQFNLRLDGQPIEIASRPAQSLFAYLALRPGAPQRREKETSAEVQQRFREVGSKIGVVCALEGLASLAVQQHEWERAVRLYAWADAARVTMGNQRPFVEQAEVNRDYATIRAQLSDEAISTTAAAGRTMTMEQAVAYA